jgi:mono/diheme cytochrome c family protein
MAVRRFILLCVLLVCVAASAQEAADAIRPPDATLLPQGRYLYQRHCVPCHGPRGDGRGEMGLTVVPRPRDFTRGIFKYRTTPSGMLPTDGDLERTVREGVSGTAMPAFAGTLNGRDIRAVVQYVKDFSVKWDRRDLYAKPLPLPPMPAWFNDPAATATHAESGRTLFQTACVSCHGEQGRGDGPAVTPELKDVWGFAAQPADLTRPVLRSGRELTDVYKVLVTGLNGTPMAGFLEATTEAQRWDLVAFIASLRTGAKQNSNQ